MAKSLRINDYMDALSLLKELKTTKESIKKLRKNLLEGSVVQKQNLEDLKSDFNQSFVMGAGNDKGPSQQKFKTCMEVQLKNDLVLKDINKQQQEADSLRNVINQFECTVSRVMFQLGINGN